ncbi:MAG: HAD family hydrolase [Mycoplasmataceae bacterium]|jgi:HAD superfamily hydrolase (TIGR01549 family)|nr:HAD family hydrolase [Mycoplasmataceae bacterium]
MIKGIIFDFGGTLYKDNKQTTDAHFQEIGEILINFLKRHGINIDMKAKNFYAEIIQKIQYSKIYYKKHDDIEFSPYKLLKHIVLKDFIKTKQLPTLKIIANNFVNIIMNYESAIRDGNFRSNAAEVLKYLNGKYKIGLISNSCSHDFVLIKLLKENIYQYFDENCILISSQVGIRKPNKLIFTEAAKELDLLPEECIYVGDTTHEDVEGARKAGFAGSIRVTNDIPYENIDAFPNDTNYLINDLNDIESKIYLIEKLK